MVQHTSDCIVVGLGAVGSAVLYQLAKRGVAATGLDMFAPPHDRGSSHGSSRITRRAVGEGERYVAFVKASHAIWDELEAETGLSLFRETGCLTIGAVSRPSKPNFVQNALAIADKHGIAYSQLSDADLRARFPQFVIADGTTGFLEIGAGVLFPEACLTAQLRMAERLGATIRRGVSLTRLERDGAGLAVVTGDGDRHLAPHVVMATGAWLPRHVGAPLSAVQVERQVRFTFKTATSPSWNAEVCPVFIRLDRSDDHHTYGFPELAKGAGVTMATEKHETTIDPEGYDRSVPPEERDAFYAEFVNGQFNGLSGDGIEAAPCLYTTTPSNHFVIDRHPLFEAATIVSACSGHGFKHSAGIGHYIANHLTGLLDPAFSIRNALPAF